MRALVDDLDNHGEVVNKVPFLGDIPYAGVLFRSTETQNDKAELLIFVTPRILEEGAKLY